MQWMHLKTVSAFFKCPLSRLVKMMHLLHPPQMSRLWISSIMTDLPTDFLFYTHPPPPTPVMPSSILGLCGEYKSHGESSSSLLLQILHDYNIVLGRAPPPPYNVGSSGYTHTHMHACTHTHMHTHARAHTCTHTHTHTHTWKGNGNPVQYSCLENCMDREA